MVWMKKEPKKITGEGVMAHINSVIFDDDEEITNV